jgi:hypothetical protein
MRSRRRRAPPTAGTWIALFQTEPGTLRFPTESRDANELIDRTTLYRLIKKYDIDESQPAYVS